MSTAAGSHTEHITTRSHRPRAFVVAVAIVAVVAVAIGIWAAMRDAGPVAAEDAEIELTFTGDDASYAGDREIVAGDADVVFLNESDQFVYLVVERFDTGSALLDDELARAPEGSDFVTNEGPPGEVIVMHPYAPGRTTVHIPLEPGTYSVEAALAGDTETHVWRTAVIDVVVD